MQQEIIGGRLLIIGSLLSLMLMAFHPSGHDLQGDYAHSAKLNVLVHSVALLALPMILLGFTYARRSMGPSFRRDAALLAYGIGALAWMQAAVASGLVQTELFGRMLEAEGQELGWLRELSSYTHVVNQALAKLGVVATSLSMGLWSWSLWRDAQVPRWFALTGLITPVAMLLAQLSGHLSLGVHGFLLIILAQSAWTICFGVLLLRISGGSAALPAQD